MNLGESIPKAGLVGGRDVEIIDHHRHLGECTRGDAGGYAKSTTTAATQRPEQIRVLICIRRDQGALSRLLVRASLRLIHIPLTLAVTTSNSRAWSDARPFQAPKGEWPPPWIYPPAAPTVCAEPPSTVRLCCATALYISGSWTPAPIVTAWPSRVRFGAPLGAKSSTR